MIYEPDTLDERFTQQVREMRSWCARVAPSHTTAPMVLERVPDALSIRCWCPLTDEWFAAALLASLDLEPVERGGAR